MKPFCYIFLGCLIGIGVIIVVRENFSPIQKLPPKGSSDLHLHEREPLNAGEHIHKDHGSHNHTHTVVTYPESKFHQRRDNELVPRNEHPTDLLSLGIDDPALKEATSDPALMKILASYQPPSCGTVLTTDNKEVLKLSGGRIFQATHISDTRSEAKDGTVALHAITVPNGRIVKEIDAQDGGVTVSGNPCEIWVIDASGIASRISPENVHAVNAIISPDGRYVAFKAQYVAENALHGKFLMIADRSTMKLSSYAARRTDSTYEISPVDWVDDGKVLRVIDNWGETGGHMALKQIFISN